VFISRLCRQHFHYSSCGVRLFVTRDALSLMTPSLEDEPFSKRVPISAEYRYL
jgi:hypothetical protein